MALKPTVKNIEEVEEAFRGEYKEVNGAYVLDLDGVNLSEMQKQIEDFDGERTRLKGALDKERIAHSDTKDKYRSKLSIFDELGDVEDIQAQLEQFKELQENGNNVSSKEILELKKQLRIAKREAEQFKEDAEPRLKEYDDLKLKVQRSEIQKQVSKFVESRKDIDVNRTNKYLARDIENGNVVIDELGDLKTKDGLAIDDYVNEVVETFNFGLQNNAGISPPNGGSSQVKQADAFEKARKDKDIKSMLENAPAAE